MLSVPFLPMFLYNAVRLQIFLSPSERSSALPHHVHTISHLANHIGCNSGIKDLSEEYSKYSKLVRAVSSEGGGRRHGGAAGSCSHGRLAVEGPRAQSRVRSRGAIFAGHAGRHAHRCVSSDQEGPQECAVVFHSRPWQCHGGAEWRARLHRSIQRSR